MSVSVNCQQMLSKNRPTSKVGLFDYQVLNGKLIVPAGSENSSPTCGTKVFNRAGSPCRLIPVSYRFWVFSDCTFLDNSKLHISAAILLWVVMKMHSFQQSIHCIASLFLAARSFQDGITLVSEFVFLNPSVPYF